MANHLSACRLIPAAAINSLVAATNYGTLKSPPFWWRRITINGHISFHAQFWTLADHGFY
jgi:hypothetical protein